MFLVLLDFVGRAVPLCSPGHLKALLVTRLENSQSRALECFDRWAFWN